MTKPQFVYVSYIATTPEKLWAALTRGEFTKKYWYGRRIESAWTVGAPVTFFDRDTDVKTDGGVVLECDPPRKLVYTFRPEFDEEARKSPFSRVSFTLEPHESLVKLTLVHDELPDDETVKAFREGWAPILSSLKTFLESGSRCHSFAASRRRAGRSRKRDRRAALYGSAYALRASARSRRSLCEGGPPSSRVPKQGPTQPRALPLISR